jgi:hypothetical protein
MPFGLTNAPAIFSTMMNRIFGDMYDLTVIVYLDDIVVFSKDRASHLEHVTQVLQRLKDNQIHLKLSKCVFFEPEVEFCGHIISGQGVKVAMNKVQAISNKYLMSKNFWELRYGFKTL